MSFVKLMEAGLLKQIISQNIDGLHRKSGIPKSKLWELHGNTNLEWCKRCDKDYMRDYQVRTGTKDHSTGRKCENCGGMLYDSVINFGEDLKPAILNGGWEAGVNADLMLSLGSSLRVTPACDIPLEMVENGGKLVIVNLQKTPLNDQ